MNKIVAISISIIALLAYIGLLLSGDLINCSMWLVYSFMALIIAIMISAVYLIHLPNN